MRDSRSYKYKNYGPIPQNEYTTASSEKNIDAEVVLEDYAQARDPAYLQRQMKRKAIHPSGRRKVRGWSRLWKTNGWRAESASLQDELANII